MKTYQSVWLMLVLVLSMPLHAQQKESRVQPLTGLYKKSILHRIDSLIEAKYVLADKAKKYAEEFRRRYSSGTYDAYANAEEFAENVRTDLVAITHDKHTNFRVAKPSNVGEKAESPLHHPVRYSRLRMKEHTGFTKLEWIDGRIGYLELRRFNMLSEAREMLGVAMKFLAGADAIIVDIRENGGGMGDFLSSYFLPHPTQLTGAYYREGNGTQESWTSKAIEGERMLDVPLFLLTSKNTFSAAEYFAYDMKVRKRATLIGDSTKGGANDSQYFRLDDQFEMYLSVGMGINPVTKTNWEGVGVIPDVLVPASSALDTAIVLARAAAEEFGKRKEAKLKSAVHTMETLLDRAEKLYGTKKDRSAKAALDSMFAIGKQFALITEFFNYVLASEYFGTENRPILIAILKKSIELFPRSASAYETLATTYYDYGQKDLALQQYRKALQLDPDNINTQKRVKELMKRGRPAR
jgi:tetratricopeptide (TPR) repeat protein